MGANRTGTESSDAHRYIEKQAKWTAVKPKRVVAEEILR